MTAVIAEQDLENWIRLQLADIRDACHQKGCTFDWTIEQTHDVQHRQPPKN